MPLCNVTKTVKTNKIYPLYDQNIVHSERDTMRKHNNSCFLSNMTNVKLCVFRAKHIREMFHEFDKDNSGSISVNEVKVMLRKLNMSDDEIETLVSIHDRNNDGELQYDEFVGFLLNS